MAMTPEQYLEITRATIEAAEFCFMITLDQSGQPSARLMQPFAPEPDLTIWFGASPKSRKIQEIRRDSRMTLAYSYPPDAAYVTLIGYAAPEFDPAQRRRYWRDSFAEFWPDGPEGDDYMLIKFTTTRIEVMNIAREVASQPFGLRAVTLVRVGQNWLVKDSDTASY